MTIHHIPVCPFSQRVEILLELKGMRDRVRFEVVDITRPRDKALLAKTRGTTALPVLETEDGGVIKESLVILRYLEGRFPDPPVMRRDPYEHALEGMVVALEGDFTSAGYRFVMNQNPDRRDALRDDLLAQYAKLDDALRAWSRGGPFLFERFGYAEAVFTPMFMRFWFVDYYEGVDIPDTPAFSRVREWRDACIAHPAARQVTREEIVKLYYDYSRGAGNGALPPGRAVSSFVFEPHWRARPWPPRDKWARAATDAELGLA
nr:glutathione S-transferase family protein [Alsobacter ponti]